MSIKVSIIVPVYNTEKYLAQCLESLTKQTLSEIEILCINDGSTDSSWDILCDCQKSDSRIKAINQEKSSIGAARNTGIAAATGEYIGFVDSDDFVSEKMYELLYNRAKKGELDIVLTNINLYFNGTGKTQLFRDFQEFQSLEKYQSFSVKEMPSVLHNVGIWDKLYRRDFLKKHDLQNPINTVFEDHLFSFEALALAEKIAVVNLPLYYYRKNLPDSITGKEIKNDTYKFDFVTISQNIAEFLKEKGMWDICSQEFIQYVFSNALWHQCNIDSFPVFKTYFKKIRTLLLANELMGSSTYEIITGKKLHLYYYILRLNIPLLFFSICRLRRFEKKFKKMSEI